MNPYIEKLKAYLADRPLELGFDDMQSLLELLCYYFTVINSIENTVIRSQFMELDKLLKKLDFEENNTVSDLVSDLCCEYGRCAFAEGARTGARLVLELLDGC